MKCNFVCFKNLLSWLTEDELELLNCLFPKVGEIVLSSIKALLQAVTIEGLKDSPNGGLWASSAIRAPSYIGILLNICCFWDINYISETSSIGAFWLPFKPGMTCDLLRFTLTSWNCWSSSLLSYKICII